MLNLEVKSGERYITNGLTQEADIADFAEIIRENMGFEAYKEFKDIVEDISDIETYESDCEYYRDMLTKTMDLLYAISKEFNKQLDSNRLNRLWLRDLANKVEGVADTIYKNV